MDEDLLLELLNQAEAERDALQARVDELEGGVRNGPLNWFRDHPGTGGLIAAGFILVLGILILVLRNVHFTTQAWVVALSIAVPAAGFVSFYVLYRWRAQHQLDHPVAP